MKAIIVSLAAALIALMLLAACGTETAVVSMPPADTEAPSDAPTEAPAESGDMDTLNECLALLGMDDETAKDALGGGEENFAADGETLIGRLYATEMFGEKVEPSTMYDGDGRVIAVSIYLSGEKAEPYVESLTAAYGEPDEASDGASSESGATWQIWKTDAGQIKLIQSYGLCSLELAP